MCVVSVPYAYNRIVHDWISSALAKRIKKCECQIKSKYSSFWFVHVVNTDNVLFLFFLCVTHANIFEIKWNKFTMGCRDFYLCAVSTWPTIPKTDANIAQKGNVNKITCISVCAYDTSIFIQWKCYRHFFFYFAMGIFVKLVTVQ